MLVGQVLAPQFYERQNGNPEKGQAGFQLVIPRSFPFPWLPLEVGKIIFSLSIMVH